MSEQFRDTDEASDARFNVPYSPPESPGWVADLAPGHTNIHPSPAMRTAAGLSWRSAPGFELIDIGRAFTDTDALHDMHEVDLRTILAHLDSTARAITSELNRRHR